MIDLHVQADPEGRPPLLLLHGFLSSRNHWQPNAALSRQFRCIRVELPGHGLSPAPDEAAAYHPDALVASLEAVRRDLGIDRWFMCGASFGAGLTLRYALTHPTRVIAQAFTNANAALRPDWTGEMLTAHEQRIDDVARHGRAALRRFPYHPAHARRFPPELRATLAADADACAVTGILHLMRQAMTRLSVMDRFAQMPVPTLLVNGLRERSFQPTRARAATALPALQVADLEGGHSINIEAPAAFDAALIRFFTSVDAHAPQTAG
ncbi:alpha/beta fold hydrolase [Paracoccus gahaiensis]|uniref:Alpha/beta fold hydrolase n=1 Tax=Paracoccus gahaiensis TaxID=1706839 RepID=A0A4U0R816_9RHOB|nr:alpha/beta fold hydrolase [Paracoccus gahaiensis]TJZ90926.1 alpha/beta fold hydrolase [Paracoccus gahaiensis]